MKIDFLLNLFCTWDELFACVGNDAKHPLSHYSGRIQRNWLAWGAVLPIL
jgi:hypothetical protein